MKNKKITIIRTVAKMNGRVGLVKLSKILRGTIKTENDSLKKIEEYGIFWEYNHQGIQQLIDELMAMNYLKLEKQGVCSYLTVTEKGWQSILVPVQTFTRLEEVGETIPLYNQLKEWRQQKAKESKLQY